MLKTPAYGYLPRDLEKVSAWKTMFDPYSDTDSENVSLLRRSVSGGQKAHSSKGVSLIDVKYRYGTAHVTSRHHPCFSR